MLLINVDLPAPFSPTNACASAFYNVNANIVQGNDAWIFLRYILQLQDIHIYLYIAMLSLGAFASHGMYGLAIPQMRTFPGHTRNVNSYRR